jgi:hypothetical protein
MDASDPPYAILMSIAWRLRLKHGDARRGRARRPTAANLGKVGEQLRLMFVDDN